MRPPRRTRRAAVALALTAAAAATGVAPAQDAPRLERVDAAAGADPDGASRRPDLSAAGRLLTFESTATNLAADPNGAVRDVFVRDLAAGSTQLVSVTPDGGGADGASGGATIASGGGLVVFESDATNLVEGDTNGVRDIFARAGGGPVRRISVAADGGQANGPSAEPDVSMDGRFVTFTSAADNLVPGDRNGVEDVFVRDTVADTTRRVSARAGVEPDGRSRASAIAARGRYVTFHSTATNLVRGDTNRVADVFLRDLRTGRIERVSVSSRGVQQNRAVAQPFFIVADVSRDGRFVVFDSDADNLVRRDTNRDTDVFVRDLHFGRTERVSLTVRGRQGDNDSYFPAISPDGRYVGFSSFAGNLWPGDAAGEDVFVHDRRLGITTLLTATADGRRRGAEAQRQLLRRPALAVHAGRVAFTSTAPLTGADRNRAEDVFVRRTAAADGRIVRGPRGVTRERRPRIRLAADDPRARVFVCRLDRRVILCPRDGRLPRLRPGRHRLKVRAGGAGLRFDPTPAVRRFRVR
ncbi:MAG TPA: hypothetical protein VM266_02730 [Solirubrobacteraceae bacterium]|nr:hypothetical protein [Solirubrobacteraceae bacterium]